MQPDIFALMNCCVVALIVFSSDILAGSADSLYSAMACARRGLGLNPPLLELDILQNFITCVKGINCFRILFACSFVDLMQIPGNEFAGKFQGTL